MKIKVSKLFSVGLGLFTIFMPSIAFAQEDGASIAAAILGIIFIIFTLVFVLAWFAFCAFVMVYWILMLVDVVKRDNWESENDKVLWILVVLLAGIVGAVIYRFVVISKLGKAGKETEVKVIKKAKTNK